MLGKYYAGPLGNTQYKMTNNNQQNLGRKCSAWKDFGLGLESSLHSSLRNRVKWDLGLGVNC